MDAKQLLMQQQESSDVSSALANKMWYSMAPSIKSALKDRRVAQFKSDRKTYSPNDIISIDVADSAFLDASEAFISLKFCPLKTTSHLSDGAVSRIIRRIRIETLQGGVPLEDIENVNNLTDLLDRNTCSYEYLHRTGQVMGYIQDKIEPPYMIGTGGSAVAVPLATYHQHLRLGGQESIAAFKTKTAVNDAITESLAATNTVATNTFMIPLGFSGFLSQKKLIPLKHLGGIRINITLERPEIAMTDATNVPSYIVQDVYYHAPLVTPSDDIQRVVDSMVNRSQLILTYETYQNVFQTINSTTLNLDVRLSKTNINSIYATIRPQTALTGTTAKTSDSFATVEGSAVNKVWCTFGSQKFPDRSIETIEHQYLESALRAFNRLNHTGVNGLSLYEFTRTKHHIGVDFEMAVGSSFSGLNARQGNHITLQFELDGTAVARQIDPYVHFSRICAVGPNQQVTVQE